AGQLGVLELEFGLDPALQRVPERGGDLLIDGIGEPDHADVLAVLHERDDLYAPLDVLGGAQPVVLRGPVGRLGFAEPLPADGVEPEADVVPVAAAPAAEVDHPHGGGVAVHERGQGLVPAPYLRLEAAGAGAVRAEPV